MRRRDFIGFIGGAAAWPLTARAQQSEKPVIGRLTEAPGDAEGFAEALADFRRGMAELGYVEGKNFAAENRFKPESLPQACSGGGAVCRNHVRADAKSFRPRQTSASKLFDLARKWQCLPRNVGLARG